LKKDGLIMNKILAGRPRVQVDFAIVLRMRDFQNLGWTRMAKAYQEETGQYISRDTIKRRYLEAMACCGSPRHQS
jgi:hypothetical protein